ncbi:hypothetical protein HLB23_39210 [Nocardia uniformis]|uniref:Uncharacterized protein n=1 Tax=Nocardia uniformis TaxID=53432 RepID=A0A849CGL3_9NOCA|nr:hypothetical protein [Nocardia uniformis]NNH75817.1 hypothetical protein [Nocardia uniformis]
MINQPHSDQPGHPPAAPVYAHGHDRELLTPNQRIVFFAAQQVVLGAWLVAISLGTIGAHRSELDKWRADESAYRGDAPDLAESFFSMLFVSSVCAGVLIIAITATKTKLRHYMRERPAGPVFVPPIRP